VSILIECSVSEQRSTTNREERELESSMVDEEMKKIRGKGERVPEERRENQVVTKGETDGK